MPDGSFDAVLVIRSHVRAAAEIAMSLRRVLGPWTRGVCDMAARAHRRANHGVLRPSFTAALRGRLAGALGIPAIIADALAASFDVPLGAGDLVVPALSVAHYRLFMETSIGALQAPGDAGRRRQARGHPSRIRGVDASLLADNLVLGPSGPRQDS
jgi:hypothetical protein